MPKQSKPNWFVQNRKLKMDVWGAFYKKPESRAPSSTIARCVTVSLWTNPLQSTGRNIPRLSASQEKDFVPASNMIYWISSLCGSTSWRVHPGSLCIGLQANSELPRKWLLRHPSHPRHLPHFLERRDFHPRSPCKRSNRDTWFCGNSGAGAELQANTRLRIWWSCAPVLPPPTPPTMHLCALALPWITSPCPPGGRQTSGCPPGGRTWVQCRELAQQMLTNAYGSQACLTARLQW